MYSLSDDAKFKGFNPLVLIFPGHQGHVLDVGLPLGVDLSLDVVLFPDVAQCLEEDPDLVIVLEAEVVGKGVRLLVAIEDELEVEIGKGVRELKAEIGTDEKSNLHEDRVRGNFSIQYF